LRAYCQAPCPANRKKGKEDALIFQYLNNVEMDYEKIKLNSPQAKRLLDYIKRHDPHGMGL